MKKFLAFYLAFAFFGMMGSLPTAFAAVSSVKPHQLTIQDVIAAIEHLVPQSIAGYGSTSTSGALTIQATLVPGGAGWSCPSSLSFGSGTDTVPIDLANLDISKLSYKFVSCPSGTTNSGHACVSGSPTLSGVSVNSVSAANGLITINWGSDVYPAPRCSNADEASVMEISIPLLPGTTPSSSQQSYVTPTISLGGYDHPVSNSPTVVDVNLAPNTVQTSNGQTIASVDYTWIVVLLFASLAGGAGYFVYRRLK